MAKRYQASMLRLYGIYMITLYKNRPLQVFPDRLLAHMVRIYQRQPRSSG